MKALKYKLFIYEGTMDFVHEGGHTIEEIFIPDEKIIFNEQFVFKYPDARADIQTAIEKIEVDDKFVDILKKYLKYKNKIEKERKKYFVSTKQ